MILPMKKIRPESVKSISFLVIVAATSLSLSGCVSSPTRAKADYIVEDTNFILVRTIPGDSYETLAELYYGEPALAGKIRSLNPKLKPNGGNVVAIPKQSFNPSGVYPDGYRTIPILCYHRFTHQSSSTDRLDMPQVKLRQQLQYLLDQGYQIIALRELESYWKGEKDLPEKSAVITIDDGYRSVYEVAYPLFKEFSIPVTLFVYTDFVGAPMAINWNEAKEMNDSGLVDIQSHSKSHASLVIPEESEPEREFLQRITHEVHYPKAMVERKIGNKVTLFSYPYGDSSDTAMALLREQQIRMAVTVQRGGNPVFTNPYLLRRAMVYADDTMESFKKKLETFHQEKFQ